MIRHSRDTGSHILGTSLFIVIVVLIAEDRFLQKEAMGAVATSCPFATLCWALVYTQVSKIAMNLALMECTASWGRQTKIVVSTKMGNYRVQ